LTSLRVFPEVRSTHMTDLNDKAPRPTLFFSVYYEAAARPLPEDWNQVSVWGAAWRIFRSRPATLELYEPTWRLGAWIVLAFVYRLSTWRASGQIVVYAIDNNALENVALGRLAPLRRASVPLRRVVLRRIAGRMIDRVAFGTPAAAEFYSRTVRPRGAATQILNLNAPRPLGGDKSARTACCVGEIGERKGISVLMRAWETIELDVPGATITLVGRGPLDEVVASWCEEQPSSRRFAGQLSHEDVLETVARASVVVLPSQPWPGWREQVGDSILEGLSLGSTIVTTTETGIASWLKENGHFVVESRGSETGLAAALERALQDPIDPATVQATLPEEDGRVTADRWLHQSKPSVDVRLV
jgi:glycosyltransferase involved in cell wall biosynthesis